MTVLSSSVIPRGLSLSLHTVYPWFPSKPMYKQSNAYVNISGWTQATSASSDPYMFRLPVVDITTMKCTPSPFYNAHADAPDEPRSPRSSAGFFTPCKLVKVQSQPNRYDRWGLKISSFVCFPIYVLVCCVMMYLYYVFVM